MIIYEKLFDNKLKIEEAYNLLNEFDNACMLAPKSKPKRFLGDQRLFNKVQDEFRPCLYLSKFLPLKYIELPQDTKIQYDAKLYFTNNSFIEVECVTAMNQQDWALRREHMDKYGRTPVFGEIIATPGSIHKRDIKSTPCTTISYDEVFKITTHEFYTRIPMVFEKKFKKQVENNIYQNTILAIYVDDKYYLINPNSLTDYLVDIAYKIKDKNHCFKGVYIVGSSGNVISVEPYVINQM